MAKAENNTSERQRVLNEYRRSVITNFNKVNVQEVINTYLKERITGFDKLPAFQRADNSEVDVAKQFENPVEPDKADILKTAISNALEIDPADSSHPIIAAKEEFNDNIAALNRKLSEKKKPAPDIIANFVSDERSKVVKAIKEQHNKENEALDNLFQDPSFKENLKAINVTDDNFEAFKKESLESHKKAQETEFKKLDKALEDEINLLHSYYEKEVARINLLHNMQQTKKGDEELRNILGQLVEAGRIPDDEEGLSAATVNFDPSRGKTLLNGVEISDLSPQGPSNVFAAQLSWLNKFELAYTNLGNLSSSNQIKLLDAANRAKASLDDKGKPCNTITTEINFTHDEKQALLLAQHAYAAAIEAGFSPREFEKKNKDNNKDNDKKEMVSFINIKLNGKALKPDELFRDNPEKLKRLQERAKQIADEQRALRAFNQTARKSEFNEFKAEVIKNKKEYAKAHPHPDLAAADSSARPDSRPKMGS